MEERAETACVHTLGLVTERAMHRKSVSALQNEHAAMIKGGNVSFGTNSNVPHSCQPHGWRPLLRDEGSDQSTHGLKLHNKKYTVSYMAPNG